MELKKWSTGLFGGSYVFSISHFVFLKLALCIVPNSLSKNVYFLKFFPRNLSLTNIITPLPCLFLLRWFGCLKLSTISCEFGKLEFNLVLVISKISTLFLIISFNWSSFWGSGLLFKCPITNLVIFFSLKFIQGLLKFISIPRVILVIPVHIYTLHLSGDELPQSWLGAPPENVTELSIYSGLKCILQPGLRSFYKPKIFGLTIWA